MAATRRRPGSWPGPAAAVPAALAGAADWSEQHEQQMRVGVVHAAGNIAASAIDGASLLTRSARAGRALRMAGLAVMPASGLPGGHISFRLAGGANHAEEVPHLAEPDWHDLVAAADSPGASRCAGYPARSRWRRCGPAARCTCWPAGAATCPVRGRTASWPAAA
jgi:hypothetical protein